MSEFAPRDNRPSPTSPLATAASPSSASFDCVILETFAQVRQILHYVTHTYQLVKEIHTMSVTGAQALSDLQAQAQAIANQQAALAASLADLQNANNNIVNAITALEALITAAGGGTGSVSAADIENVVTSLQAASSGLSTVQQGVAAVVTSENSEATAASQFGQPAAQTQSPSPTTTPSTGTGSGQ